MALSITGGYQMYKLVFLAIVSSSLVFSCKTQEGASNFQSDASDSVRTTKSGKKFTRVDEKELSKLGITDTELFGQAWKDESGVIWGDVRKDEDPSNFHYVEVDEATDYCKKIGATLPTGWPEDRNNDFDKTDSDFVRLVKYLSDDPAKRWTYKPQVLPNLTYDHDGKRESRRYVTSTMKSKEDVTYYAWESIDGRIHVDGNAISRGFVRCVLKSKQ